MFEDHEALALLSVAEMGEADRRAIAGGVAGIDLMEAAGRAVAEAARRAHDAAGRGQIVILCGPGNNGGDGFVAARVLAAQGRDVALFLLGPMTRLKGDAALAAKQWTGAVGAASDTLSNDATVVVDALFGAGLDRDLDGEARALVEKVNLWRAQSGGAVVAVDVPSGLDGNSGQVRGVAISADVTVTFFRPKPGHLLLPGRTLCGRVECAQIGIPAAVLEIIQPRTFRNAPALWLPSLPPPETDGHKYRRGHALVLCGPMHRTGAARLVARGALRGGAGLVTLASPRDALAVNAAHLTAIMLTPCEGAAELVGILQDRRFNALVLGPGGGVGQPMRDCVLAALSSGDSGRGVVLDADALTSFAGAADVLGAAVGVFPGKVVLTPHDGEFARLFRYSSRLPDSKSEVVGAVSQDVRALSKLTRARAAAELTGAVVVLKGADTVVAHPDGRASIAHDLPPWLATAGSGDVLAGLIAANLARGAQAFEAACAGVWMHGAAARAFGPGLIAEDIAEQMPQVFRDLYAPVR
ncbi:MAG: NAD(P)H-hydrate dehydratase [Beijerinckiaceae bacterium]|nr:NAD(P)H-hydrate dehydratase [Beijerinckiaceae bacterium]